ncbi:uncharacterized protein LOC142976134 isoform X2 [Anticarsia gemmatalis]|uniref:uncharacterized protein LOC142976134 isoform X2 n=1 Tax=Anticarsia gemmatalis TaxID=129554 RepID=UPI003F75BAF4
MLDQRYSDNDISRRDIPSFIEPRPPLIQNPFMRPRPQKGTNLLELFEEDSEIEEPELVQVYLRLKPCKVPNTLYEVRSDRCLVTSLDTATAGHGRRTQHNVSKMYTFSKIFGPECNQKEIFEQVVKDNLKKLPDGHNFTLLTYGASGSGKTYTLMGTVGSPGLVPRSLEYVFRLVDAAQQPAYRPAESGAEKLNYAEQDYELQWVKRLRHVSAPLRDKYRRMSAQLHTDLTISSIDLSSRVRHYVWVSFVEIYNEAIYDLLAPPEKRTKLRIREDTSGNVYVKGATQAFVRSGEEAYDVMVAGKHNLVVAATGVHAHSSRSHCIFTITMLTETGDGGVRTSYVRLCDLAGCERARATRNTGARMQESRAINSSLHVLERCLHMLRRKQKTRNDALVPYRESKLTRLLGTGLSGARGEAVSMVVTLNPSPEYAHETKHVLTLAAVAQDIQINNTILGSTTLESSTQETTISCSNEVMKLRADNERLHFELVQAQARNKELIASMEERQQEAGNTMKELVEEAKDMTRQYYEAQLKALQSEMDDMVEEYEARLAQALKEAPPANSGTPARYREKVAQLMTEIAVLEEQLTAEKLARARAEKEVQHLRTCIEERDEKAFKDATPPPDVMALSDSDHESDDETSDPFNESLEPIFKKEMNKSVAKHDNTSVHTIDNIEEIDERVNEDNEIQDKTNNTIVSNDSNSTICDEQNSTITDVSKCESVHKNATYESSGIDSANVTYDNEIEKPNDNFEDSLKDENKTYDGIKEENCSKESSKSNFVCRGTYFVSDSKINDEKEKSTTSLRGTYFVKDLPTNEPELESNDKDESMEFFKEPVIIKPNVKVAEKVSETLVSKIIRSLKSTQGSDSSLRQFEQLEMAAKECQDDTQKSQNQSVFGDIKMLKEKRTYFDNEPTSKPVVAAVESPKDNKEKRTYFDNIDVNVEVPNKKLNEIMKNDEERSPSIVKDGIMSDNFEPSKIKKLLGESFTKPEIITSVHKKRMAKKQESVDLFESPIVVLPKIDNVEIARQSIEQLVLDQQSAKKSKPVEQNSPIKQIKSPMKKDVVPSSVKSSQPPFKKDYAQSSLITELPASLSEFIAKKAEKVVLGPIDVKKDIKLEPMSSLEEKIKPELKKEMKLEPTSSVEEPNQTIDPSNMTARDNTIEEFENIYKDITAPRATEFELLVSESETDKNDKEVKYNLRKKHSKSDDSKTDKKQNDDVIKTVKKVEINEEILLESNAKCEAKGRKRPLRLRRRKNQGEDEGEEKLKDIVNLQSEFSDVTMDVPAPHKVVKDIPSPEKGAEENLPPILGIQSCPAKRAERYSRRYKQ